MRENELRDVVDAVVRTLVEKGYLKKGDCGCKAPSSPYGSGSVKVTTGTAGKVFSSEPWKFKKEECSTPKPAPKGEADHTHGPDCPQCDSAAGLRDHGADRIGVCHPTKQCNQVAQMVDHTLLAPGATQEQVAKLCEEAKNYCFASVCVNPSYVSLASQVLAGSGVKVCTVIGFPLGSTTPTVKAIEARDAIANGASEIDMVINVGALKSGNDELVRDDIRAVREATRGKVLKVILETALLNDDEKKRACAISKEEAADFVKTSTGFGPGGATVEDIRLMRESVGPRMGVKASGGIRDTAKAKAMIEAGATRLGTSASVAIVTDKKPAGKGNY